MKKIIVVLLVCFIQCNLFSQNNNALVYNDVIVVNDENVATDGSDYIINIPLEKNTDLVIDLSRFTKIPNQVFFQYSFAVQFKSVTVVSPDFEYNKRVAKFATKMGGCAKPVPSFKIYTIKTDLGNTVSIDSITYNITYPKERIPVLHYKNIAEKKENQIAVYFTESWGSICCPKDEKFILKNEIIQLLKKEKEKYKDKKSKTYIRNFGYEGEHQKYFTLSDFTPSERLDFIKNRLSVFNKRDYEAESPRLFFPYFINNLNLKEFVKKIK